MGRHRLARGISHSPVAVVRDVEDRAGDRSLLHRLGPAAVPPDQLLGVEPKHGAVPRADAPEVEVLALVAVVCVRVWGRGGGQSVDAQSNRRRRNQELVPWLQGRHKGRGAGICCMS